MTPTPKSPKIPKNKRSQQGTRTQSLRIAIRLKSMVESQNVMKRSRSLIQAGLEMKIPIHLVTLLLTQNKTQELPLMLVTQAMSMLNLWKGSLNAR